MDASPFHSGEIAAQERAGVREQMEKVGRAVLRDFMPDQHRAFFPLLPMFFIGGSAGDGGIWASTLWGEPGFVQSPDPTTLRIDARLMPEDPLAASMRAGAQLGCLGLQFETRRRNRANGIVTGADVHGLTLKVLQSFGNCPKYIQTREPVARVAQEGPPPIAGNGPLPDAALALIRQCDTFFIATAASHGADMSHRGGRSGFVHADADGTLTWPDFQGNNLFNTIGNLTVDGRAGLLFIDFDNGDLLHLSGSAKAIWDGPERDGFAGAKRLLRFHTQRYLWRQGRLPLRWRLNEVSPHLAATGVW